MAKKISAQLISNWIFESISSIPEPKIEGDHSDSVYVKKLIRHSALKSSSVSAALSLPGGVAGYVSIIPDVLAIWRLQSQMVTNIASAYGKQADITHEQLLWCMFKQFGLSAFKEVISQQGSRYLIKRVGPETRKRIIEKLGYGLVGSHGGKAISRVVPVLGSVSAGALSYYDTWRVGNNARAMYSKEIRLLD